ncbi:MAG: hypothetical protein ACTH4Y_08210 [Microbacterium gubbeenense]|uniref:hypothetical protein n=1 Tax=Microbacterium gubbeenense TaxID=159896 RepID=UPI003F9BCDF5
MSPDELRVDAGTLEAYGKRHGSVAGDSPAPEFELALEAMRRLADVIEYAERDASAFGSRNDVLSVYGALQILRIARGGTNEGETDA